MGTQPSLFNLESNTEPVRADAGRLLVRSQPGRQLTKAQRAFNRLVEQIERLRRQLDEEVRRLDAALAYYGEHIHPRLKRQNTLRKETVRALVPFLDGHSLKTKRERKGLRRLLALQLDMILEYEGPQTDPDLKALFERLHRVDLAQVQKEDMNGILSAMHDVFDDLGVDVDLSGFQPGMSEEAFAQNMAELTYKLDQAHDGPRTFEEEGRRKKKGPSEKEARRLRAEEARKKTVASIYRQLAKVLHPDLEPDTVVRDRKVKLMQELTVAYRENDLHTLLRMELQWIQGEKGDIARLTDEKLAIYNQVLKEQAEALELEIAELPFHPRYQPIVIPDGPFEVYIRTDSPAEARRLDGIIEALEASLTALQTSNAIEEVRELIQEIATNHKSPV